MIGLEIKDESDTYIKGSNGLIIGVSSSGMYTSYNGLNQYTNFGNDASLDIERTDSFVFRIKFYLDDITSVPIFNKYDSILGRGIILFVDSSSRLNFIISNDNLGGDLIQGTSAILSLSNWYEVEFEYSGNSLISGCSIKLDGISKAITTLTDNLNATISNTNDLILGVNAGMSNFTEGFIEYFELDVNGSPVSAWSLTQLNPTDSFGSNDGTSVGQTQDDIIGEASYIKGSNGLIIT